MPIDIETQSPTSNDTAAERHAYRFHAPHLHLQSVFGDDWFALKAEAFARFFGTPSFLIAQTVIVAMWILVAGRIGAALCAHSLGKGWVCRMDGTRAVTITPKGQRIFREQFGVSWDR